MRNFLINLCKYLLWPALLAICVGITRYGYRQDQLLLFFNLAYLFLACSLYLLEKWLPAKKAWLSPDGQNLASLLHTITSKGAVQVLFASSAIIGLTQLFMPAGENASLFWPTHWSFTFQVLFGMFVAEFGLYWAHRISHEHEFFWRFHAIHHSVVKLWFWNTGRFHFVDSLISIGFALCLLIIFGAPMEVVQWVSVMTAFIGMLTHCNADIRCGPINYIFNTPELHRWHHSKVLSEGNRNYGENLVIWDLAFRTYFNGKYAPPTDIGIKELMPTLFVHQLIWPFLNREKRKKIQPGYQPLPFVREKRESTFVDWFTDSR